MCMQMKSAKQFRFPFTHTHKILAPGGGIACVIFVIWVRSDTQHEGPSKTAALKALPGGPSLLLGGGEQ